MEHISHAGYCKDATMRSDLCLPNAPNLPKERYIILEKTVGEGEKETYIC
jgi:hypothetical protein